MYLRRGRSQSLRCCTQNGIRNFITATVLVSDPYLAFARYCAAWQFHDPEVKARAQNHSFQRSATHTRISVPTMKRTMAIGQPGRVPIAAIPVSNMHNMDA